MNIFSASGDHIVSKNNESRDLFIGQKQPTRKIKEIGEKRLSEGR
jgi:hypothetical protein